MKSENDVIARCTEDTNVTQAQDKGILRRADSLDALKPVWTVSNS